MYVRNHDSVSRKYKCNKLVYKYLIGLGFCLLSRDENDYYFSLTENLSKTLEKMPLYLRPFKGVQLGK